MLMTMTTMTTAAFQTSATTIATMSSTRYNRSQLRQLQQLHKHQQHVHQSDRSIHRRRSSITRTTTSTQLQAATLSTLLSGIDVFFQTSPYTAAALVCGIKASAADGVAQFQEYKETRSKATTTSQRSRSKTKSESSSSSSSNTEENVDVRRNVAFITYGALYQGITQEFIYNHLYPIWFGTGTGILTVLSKVSFSLLIQTTLLTLPSLYIIKSIIERQSIQQAITKYWYDIQYQQLLQKFYILWGPVLSLTFSVIPQPYRVTFIAIISFFWLIILSGISNNNNNVSPETKDEYCLIGQDICEFSNNSKE